MKSKIKFYSGTTFVLLGWFAECILKFHLSQQPDVKTPTPRMWISNNYENKLWRVQRTYTTDTSGFYKYSMLVASKKKVIWNEMKAFRSLSVLYSIPYVRPVLFLLLYEEIKCSYPFVIIPWFTAEKNISRESNKKGEWGRKCFIDNFRIKTFASREFCWNVLRSGCKELLKAPYMCAEGTLSFWA